VSHTWSFAVIGHPITHSLSPVLHQGFFQASGLPGTYTREDVPPNALAQFVAAVRAGDTRLDGFNVTIPHKEAILPLLDDLTPQAQAVRAVNTVRVDPTTRQLIGHNTDGTGYYRSLPAGVQAQLSTLSLCMLGAGGSARAVASTLLSHQVPHLTLCVRTPAKGEALKDALSHLAPHATIEVAPWPTTPKAWTQLLTRHGLLINTTPMGMSTSAEVPTSPSPPEAFAQLPRPLFVSDLIYKPSTTPLMTAAQRSGHPTWNGLGMLFWQGAEAFEWWTGVQLAHDHLTQQTFPHFQQLTL